MFSGSEKYEAQRNRDLGTRFRDSTISDCIRSAADDVRILRTDIVNAVRVSAATRCNG